MNTSQQPKKVALYMRYSSAAQNDGFSIEAQDKALTKYCLDNNYTIVERYIDRACTGTNANREEFQRMIDDSKTGKFDNVFVHKTDRFSRNRFDAILYKNELKKNGVKVISITENFGDGIEAELLEGIQESMAEFYSKNLAREVRKGMDIVASKGLHTGGVAPLGYDVGEDRKLHINDSEATIVRLIFNMYANGYTYNQIAKELNLKGYKTKVGKEFTGASLNSILHNRKYIGEYVYNRRVEKNAMGKRNAHKNKPDDQIIRIPNGVPKIVDEATFNKVQKRLDCNKSKTGSYKSNSQYLLSGLVVCGVCGFKYQGNTRASGKGNSSIYSSYRCGKKQNHKGGCNNGEIEKNKLENFVLEQLQKYLFTDEAILKIKELVNNHNKEIAKTKNVDVIQYKNELKNINKQIENLTNAIAKGVAEDIFVDKINSLTASKKELISRIDTLTEKEFPEVKEDDIKNAMSKFQQYIKENNTVEIRNFLDSYIDKIVVYPDNVEINFKIASEQFNSEAIEDDIGKVLVDVEITRDEFKNQPKQKRKFNSEAVIESNSVKYDIAG